MKFSKKETRASINENIYKSSLIYCLIRVIIYFLFFYYDYLFYILNLRFNFYTFELQVNLNFNNIMINILIGLVVLPFLGSLLHVINLNKNQTKRFFIYIFKDFFRLLIIFAVTYFPSTFCMFLSIGLNGRSVFLFKIIIGLMSVILMNIFEISAVILVKYSLGVKQTVKKAYRLFFTYILDFLKFYLSFAFWGILIMAIFISLSLTPFNKDWAMIFLNACLFGFGVYLYPLYYKSLMVLIDNLIKIDNKS